MPGAVLGALPALRTPRLLPRCSVPGTCPPPARWDLERPRHLRGCRGPQSAPPLAPSETPLHSATPSLSSRQVTGLALRQDAGSAFHVGQSHSVLEALEASFLLREAGRACEPGPRAPPRSLLITPTVKNVGLAGSQQSDLDTTGRFAWWPRPGRPEYLAGTGKAVRLTGRAVPVPTGSLPLVSPTLELSGN